MSVDTEARDHRRILRKRLFRHDESGRIREIVRVGFVRSERVRDTSM